MPMTPITLARDVPALRPEFGSGAGEVDFTPMAGWQDLVAAATVLVVVALAVIAAVAVQAWRNARSSRVRPGDGTRDVPLTP
jgi:hypothetical protein